MFNTDFNFYAFCLIIALILNTFFVCKNTKVFSFSKVELLFLLFYEYVGIFLGGKLGGYIIHLDNLNGKTFCDIGFYSYGCLIGLVIFLFIYKLHFKISYKVLMYVLGPIFPLMYAVGKIGCFLVGCCYGIKYSGLFSVVYNYSEHTLKGVSLFPIQLVEAIIFFIIFLYFIKKFYKYSFNIRTLCLLCLSCSISKFILDFFRYNHYGKLITLNQIISLIFIIGSLIVIIRNRKITKNK